MNEDRINAFTEEIGDLKLRGASKERERWLLILGTALLIAGVALAVVGGIQASGTTDSAEAWAALATGTFLGFALVIAGTALFVRYSLSKFLRFWLIRLVHEHRSETDRLIAAIEKPDNERILGGIHPTGADRPG
jgi:uncharacterized membrane-anchored protein